MGLIDKIRAEVERKTHGEQGYFVQKLRYGFFTDKWVDIKGFGDKKKAEELLEILEG